MITMPHQPFFKNYNSMFLLICFQIILIGYDEPKGQKIKHPGLDQDCCSIGTIEEPIYTYIL